METPQNNTNRPDPEKLSDIDIARRDVEERDFTLSIVRDGKTIFHSKSPGISALVTAIDRDRYQFRGASTADRILGRAAALLFVYSRVGHIFASVASRDALTVLKQFRVPFGYLSIVEKILNKDKTSTCPFENMVRHVESPEEAFDKLKPCGK